MALTFAVTCLLLLSSGAVKLLAQQGNPPLNKECTNETERDLLGVFSPECLAAFQTLDFTDVATILNVSALNRMDAKALCSEACLPTLTNYLNMCYNTTTGLPDAFERGVCLFNENGELCFIATIDSIVKSSSGTPWVTRVMDNCFINFTLIDATPTETCSDDCSRALQQGGNELGCCFDAIYNNKFVSKYLPFAEYSLWSKCGLVPPGVCSSASAISMGIYISMSMSPSETMLIKAMNF